MFSVVKLVGLVVILWSLPSVWGIVYIDQVVQDSSRAVVNLSLTYTHGADGDSVTNITYETFVTISKVMLYFTLKIADNQENIGVYRDLVKTVIDVEKLIKGSQANPIVKGYFDNIKRSMNFTLKFPLPPGTYKMINVIIDTAAFYMLPDSKGLVDFRAVGKYGNSSKMRYLGHIALSGGYRRG